MGHNLEASLPPIVGRDVAPDESPKSGHAVQGNAGRATSALEIARNPRSLNSKRSPRTGQNTSPLKEFAGSLRSDADLGLAG
jgi:hypothetical protein